MTTALVTGALGGIGSAICAELAKTHNVIGLDRPEKAPGDFPYQYLSMDIADGVICRSSLPHYDIGILVNCAGITRDAKFSRMTFEQWNEVIRVNLTGVFNVIKGVWDGMLSRNYGRIVNIASVNAFLCPIGQVNYAATKAAVIAMTKVLAKEGARNNVHVNAVAPGYVDTPMVRKIAPEILEKIIATVPLGRLLRPEEIAKAVVYLVSELADVVNGETFHINGGLYEIDHAIYAEE